MDESRCDFQKCERLRKRRDFLGVYERGTKVQGTYFVLYLLENHLPYHRLGLTVSRKIGSSVVRNRIKRRLREAFRQNKRAISPYCDVVVNAKRAAAAAATRRIREDFLEVVRGWQQEPQGRRGSQLEK